MFVPCGNQPQELNFEGATLVLPAISCGNIGQLACDLLLFNSSETTKVGYLRSMNVVPVVGNDALAKPGEAKGEIILAIELYSLPSKKTFIMQQRSPIIRGRLRKHAEELADWIKKQKFAKLYMIGGADSGCWTGEEVVYRKFFMAYTPAVKQDHVEGLLSQGVNKLDKKPCLPAMDPDSRAEDLYPVARAGLFNVFLEACEKHELSCLSVVLFCKEGHNVSEGMSMAELINRVLNLIDMKTGETYTKWHTPASWQVLFG